MKAVPALIAAFLIVCFLATSTIDYQIAEATDTPPAERYPMLCRLPDYNEYRVIVQARHPETGQIETRCYVETANPDEPPAKVIRRMFRREVQS